MVRFLSSFGVGVKVLITSILWSFSAIAAAQVMGGYGGGIQGINPQIMGGAGAGAFGGGLGGGFGGGFGGGAGLGGATGVFGFGAGFSGDGGLGEQVDPGGPAGVAGAAVPTGTSEPRPKAQP